MPVICEHLWNSVAQQVFGYTRPSADCRYTLWVMKNFILNFFTGNISIGNERSGWSQSVLVNLRIWLELTRFLYTQGSDFVSE